jgi:hypothetical protein
MVLPAQVSAIRNLSPVDKEVPERPSMEHGCPLTQVLVCERGLGPRRSNSPKSFLNSSDD